MHSFFPYNATIFIVSSWNKGPVQNMVSNEVRKSHIKAVNLGAFFFTASRKIRRLQLVFCLLGAAMAMDVSFGGYRNYFWQKMI